MTLVWPLPLPHADKIVLLALADNANDEGWCFPSIQTLSTKCSLDPRSIYRVIARLEDAGHVSRRERPGKSTVYSVHPRTPDTKSPLTESQSCQRVSPDGRSVTPDRKSSPPLTQGQVTPDTQSPITIREPPIEPSLNRQGARASRSRQTAQRLPMDFGLTEKRREIAKMEGVDPDREFARFCDHWRAASGANARKHDWDAAWRNWCRKANDIRRSSQPGRRSFEERLAALGEESL